MHFVKEYNFQFHAEQPKTNRKKLRWIVAAITIIVAVSVGLTAFFLIKRYQTKESNEKSDGQNPKLTVNENKKNDGNIDGNKDLEENEHVDDNENKKNEIEKTQSESGENEEEKKIEEEKQKLLEEEKQRLLKEERLAEEKRQRLLEEKRQRLLEEARLAEEEKQRNINEYTDLANQMKIINESHKNLMFNKVFVVKENITLGDQEFITKYGNNFKTTGEAIDINIKILEQKAKDTENQLTFITDHLKNEYLPPVEVPDYKTSILLLGEEGTKTLIDSFKKQKISGNIFRKFFNSISNIFVDRLKSIIFGKTMGNNVKQVDIDYSEQLTLKSVEDLKKFKEKAKAVINYYTRDYKDLIQPKYIDISSKLFDDLWKFKDDGTIEKTKHELNATKVITDIHNLKTAQLYKCLKINLLTAFLKKNVVESSWIGYTDRYNAYVNNNGWIKLTEGNLNNSIVLKDIEPVYEEIKQLITDVYKDVSKESLKKK